MMDDKTGVETCVKCNDLIYGCQTCELVEQREFFESTEQVVQCKSCDYSSYLLTFDSDLAKTQDALPRFNATRRMSMCVSDCNDFAYNYVSNPNTMTCEYCGPECTHCTL
jgi:hypothetical protein